MKKIVNGQEVILTKQEDEEILLEWKKNRQLQAEQEKQFGYIQKRQAEYPQIGDQLDAILKHMSYMQMTMARRDIDFEERVKRCCNLVSELDTIVSKWLSVKAKYPKPEA